MYPQTEDSHSPLGVLQKIGVTTSDKEKCLRCVTVDLQEHICKSNRCPELTSRTSCLGGFCLLASGTGCPTSSLWFFITRIPHLPPYSFLSPHLSHFSPLILYTFNLLLAFSIQVSLSISVHRLQGDLISRASAVISLSVSHARGCSIVLKNIYSQCLRI